MTATGDSRVDAVYLDPQRLTYGSRSPLNVAKALLDQRFFVGQTFGVSGERSDQVLARMLNGTGDPRKTNAGILYLQVGVNDVAQASAGFVDVVSGRAINIVNVAENTIANIKRIASLGAAAGMTPVIENEVGANDINQPEKTAALMDLRQAITEYGEMTPGTHVHDAFAIIANPTASATTITLRPTLVYDQTHPNGLGAYLWGKSLATLLSGIIPTSARGSLLIQNIAEGSGRRQLLANPLFTTATRGTGGTGITSGTLTANTTSGSSSLVVTAGRIIPSGTHVTGPGIPANTFANTTGTVGTYALVNAGGGAVNATASATGITVNTAIVPQAFGAGVVGGATATIDSVSSASGMGNDVTIAAAFAGNGDAVRFSQALSGSSTGGGQYNAALRTGDIVQAVALVEFTAAPVNLATLYLSLLQNSGSGSTSMTSFDLYSANSDRDYGVNEPCRMTLATRPFALAAPTGIFPYLTAEVRAVGRAAGSCNFTIRQLGVRRRNAAY